MDRRGRAQLSLKCYWGLNCWKWHNCCKIRVHIRKSQECYSRPCSKHGHKSDRLLWDCRFCMGNSYRICWFGCYCESQVGRGRVLRSCWETWSRHRYRSECWYWWYCRRGRRIGKSCKLHWARSAVGSCRGSFHRSWRRGGRIWVTDIVWSYRWLRAWKLAAMSALSREFGCFAFGGLGSFRKMLKEWYWRLVCTRELKFHEIFSSFKSWSRLVGGRVWYFWSLSLRFLRSFEAWRRLDWSDI